MNYVGKNLCSYCVFTISYFSFSCLSSPEAEARDKKMCIQSILWHFNQNQACMKESVGIANHSSIQQVKLRKHSQTLVHSSPCVFTGDHPVEERRHREEEYVSPSSHRLSALRVPLQS